MKATLSGVYESNFNGVYESGVYESNFNGVYESGVYESNFKRGLWKQL